MSKNRFSLFQDNSLVSDYRTLRMAEKAGDKLSPARSVHVCNTLPRGIIGSEVGIIWKRIQVGNWMQTRTVTIQPKT